MTSLILITILYTIDMLFSKTIFLLVYFQRFPDAGLRVGKQWGGINVRIQWPSRTTQENCHVNVQHSNYYWLITMGWWAVNFWLADEEDVPATRRRSWKISTFWFGHAHAQFWVLTISFGAIIVYVEIGITALYMRQGSIINHFLPQTHLWGHLIETCLISSSDITMHNKAQAKFLYKNRYNG